jgi:UDP-2-acetamido-2,6-beta-L-arabino-hexul-4-ose reductase
VNLLITGSKGFIGSNLAVRLREIGTHAVSEFDVGSTQEDLEKALRTADVVYHLAGLNRPLDPADFKTGNHGLTADIVRFLEKSGRNPLLILSSSTQAALENAYGESKRLAEEEIFGYAERTGAPVAVYRFQNVFGKWSKPNYNTVVATFCFNAAHGIPLRVDDPEKQLDFLYIDDVVEELISYVKGRIDLPAERRAFRQVSPVLRITLGRLASIVEEIAHTRTSGRIQDLADPFRRYLGSMFLTYLEKDELIYSALKKSDNRGYLCELLKSPHGGQVFMSVTRPGITRGNHYHHTKVEKFIVVKGTGLIRLTHILDAETREYRVEGEECRIVDIPPGFAHSITNIGAEDMIALFWANEIFDPDRPDTFPMET